jgi:RNA polymerase sigma-70 factor (ECF subfamily)
MSAMPVGLGESGERYSGADENRTLALLRAGDEAAFLELVDRYAPAMQKIARAFTIVVNRAKTRGVREARSVPFSALARDETERDDPSVAPGRFAGPGEEWPRHWRDGPVPWGDRPEERLLSRELRARIDAAIDALPAVQRSVVILRDIAGQPTQDVGNALDLSETNVRVLLHRARAKLRRALDPYLTGEVLA